MFFRNLNVYANELFVNNNAKNDCLIFAQFIANMFS